MKLKTIAVLLLLGLATFSLSPSRAETVEDEDGAEIPDNDTKAFLLVRRKLSHERPEVKKPFTITVEVYNVGKSPATNVVVNEEATWSKDIFETKGKLAATYDTIPAGAIKSFEYDVIGKIPTQRYDSEPIKLSYIAEKDGNIIKVSSMGVGVRIFSSTELLTDKLVDIGSTLSLGILKNQEDWKRFAIVVGSFIVVFSSYSAYTTLNKKRAASREKRALRDLGFADLKTD